MRETTPCASYFCLITFENMLESIMLDEVTSLIIIKSRVQLKRGPDKD